MFKLKQKLAFSLLYDYDAAIKTAKKRLFKFTEHLELNNYTSMVAKVKNKSRTNEAENWQKN